MSACFVRRVFFAGNQFPVRLVERSEVRIAIDMRVDASQVNTPGKRQECRIDLASADDHDFGRIAC